MVFAMTVARGWWRLTDPEAETVDTDLRPTVGWDGKPGVTWVGVMDGLESPSSIGKRENHALHLDTPKA
jgi:hypothetical protein